MDQLRNFGRQREKTVHVFKTRALNSIHVHRKSTAMKNYFHENLSSHQCILQAKPAEEEWGGIRVISNDRMHVIVES